jgi:hypothetical protein
MTDSLDRLVAIYRGWQELEVRLQSGTRVIDFDLAPAYYKAQAFDNRLEVRDALGRLLTDIPSGHTFLKSRVAASITFTSALLGEPIPFDDYIQRTLGMVPEPVPQPIVVAQRDRILCLLDDADIPFEPDGIPGFARRFHIDSLKIIAAMSEAIKVALTRTCAFLGIDSKPLVDVRFVESHAYWKSWTEGRLGEMTTVQFNTTPRRPYLRGDSDLLAFHEVGGHALQMELWRTRIASGTLHAAYGVTVVHGPEQFLAEGLAQILTDAIFEDQQLSTDVRWSREYERYLLYVYQYVHIQVNNGGSVPAAIKYVRENAPFENEATIEVELLGRRNDPLLRTYQFVYASSACYFVEVLKRLGRESFRSLLKQLYPEPLSTGMLKRIVDDLEIETQCKAQDR